MSMNHDYETGVALSDSVNKTCVKRPLAEKSRWRHIRFEIKPRYLENHASKITSYYWTLSGSHGRSFRIRHEKLPEAPLAEKTRWRHTRHAINKTSLSRKPCLQRFYCKTDKTSSWFIHQGALHAIFHDGFWKSDHDFLIVIHSNFSCLYMKSYYGFIANYSGLRCSSL